MTSSAARELAASLERAVPRVSLCTLPTPLERAEKIEQELGTGPLFVKRDDQSAPEYGGNKARKLEFLLGRLRQRGVSRVMTFGGLGTNHGFATAYYAGRLGLACELVLVDQPLSDAVRQRLLLHQAAGARLFYGRNVSGTVLVALARLARHPRTALIPVGGSNAWGTLGFVNAGLELARQVDEGLMPEPARVYVACGSGGTAAGLALGLALSGLRTRVVPVLVNHILPPSPASLRRLARRTQGVLRRIGAVKDDVVRGLRLDFEARFLGPGYGHATPKSTSALRAAQQLEGLRLDPTYTAKAFAALLEREHGRRDPIVFWNSYAGQVPELVLPDWRGLPSSFHRFFRESA